MKKIPFLLLALTLCFSLSLGPVAQAAVITVDGSEVKQVDQSGNPVPEVESGLVPIRAVLNAMGYSIAYDEETGLVRGGTFADPEFVFAPGDDGSVLVDGTTFIGAERIAEALPFDLQTDNGTIAYTSTFAEMPEGWYKLCLDGRYLTAHTLPEADRIETKLNDDGTEEEVTKTPVQQVLATELFLADDDGSDYQLWLVRKIGNKTYAMINKATGLVADVNSWSRDNGAKIIQYTPAGGTNQQFTFEPIDDGYSVSPVFSRLYLANVAEDKFATGLGENVVVQTSDKSAKWNLEFVEDYINPVLLVRETEAFAELDPYTQERFTSYFFTDADFSSAAMDKAETLLRNGDFVNQDKEGQKQLIKEALSVTHDTFGSMHQRLTADFEIVSVEEKLRPRYDVDYNEIGEILYHVYTIAMTCGGPDDIHTFTIETVDPDDEEYVRRVCEAIACFEPPVRKSLRHFYYTGEDYGMWNAWDGEIWNNAAYKDDIDEMLPMFAHELGHVIDSYFTVGDDVWLRAMYADIVPISDYGKTDRWEDFGEFSNLYLYAIGDADRIAAIEKVYPNRTKTYRAALYNLDNDYYADYKDEYEEVTAPIGNTEGVVEDMYYSIVGPIADRALTNNNGIITFDYIENGKMADNQLWQISVLDGQLVKFYSKADGRALYLPNTVVNTPVEASFGDSTAFGIYSTYEKSQIVAAETGRGFAVSEDDYSVISVNGAGQQFSILPAEKIEGIGDFMITSGDRYLVPENGGNGAPLMLSDSVENSLWHIYRLPNGTGYITGASSGLAIDISGASTDEGASAIAYTLSRNDNQTWLIIENENGTVSFQAQHSGLYLAVDNEGKAIQSEKRYEWTLGAKEA